MPLDFAARMKFALEANLPGFSPFETPTTRNALAELASAINSSHSL